MSQPTNLINLAPGVWVEPTLVESVRPSNPTDGGAPADLRVLDELHPMWNVGSGGDRNEQGRQWSLSRVNDAAVLLAGVRDMKGGKFFDLIRSEPGRLFSVAEIVETLPDTFANGRTIAGSLLGFRKYVEAANLVYPWYWWKGCDDQSTLYAVRPSVAAVFAAAESRGTT